MKFFALFIYRPVATILLSVAITLCGILGFRMLPVAPLPQVDFPVIMVSASLPGASPETMASSVATPLERSLGRIAGVSEMTSSSSLGSQREVDHHDGVLLHDTDQQNNADNRNHIQFATSNQQRQQCANPCGG